MSHHTPDLARGLWTSTLISNYDWRIFSITENYARAIDAYANTPGSLYFVYAYATQER